MPLKIFEDGDNILHDYAGFEGYVDQLKDVLNEATVEDIIRANRDGNNPIHVACSADHKDGPEVLRELLKKALDLDKISKENGEALLDPSNMINEIDGKSPLHIATINRSEGCVQLIKTLLEYGARIDEPNKKDQDMTPIQYAVLYKNKKAFNELILQNADFRKSNAEGKNAINIAQENCHNAKIIDKDASDILMTLMSLDINSPYPKESLKKNFSEALSSSAGLDQRPIGTTFSAESALSTSGVLSKISKVVGGSVNKLLAGVKSSAQEGKMTHSYEPLTDSEAGVDPDKPPSQYFFSRVFQSGVKTSSAYRELNEKASKDPDNLSDAWQPSPMEVKSDFSDNRPSAISDNRPSPMEVKSDFSDNRPSPISDRPSAMEVKNDLMEPLLRDNKQPQR
jgi:Ankyrin repeats (3 copies)